MIDKSRLEQTLDGILEKLASIEHERWSHWQSYVHSNCIPSGNKGALLIPADLVNQWERQIATSYEHLTEKEKESDREQVRKYLPLIIRSIAEDTDQ